MDHDDVAVCGGIVEGVGLFTGRIGMNGAQWLCRRDLISKADMQVDARRFIGGGAREFGQP